MTYIQRHGNLFLYFDEFYGYILTRGQKPKGRRGEDGYSNEIIVSKTLDKILETIKRLEK